MFWTVTQALMSGLWTTFEIFILTLIFALPLGLVFAFGLLSRFKPVKAVMNVFVWVIRGTPLMLLHRRLRPHRRRDPRHGCGGLSVPHGSRRSAGGELLHR